MNKFYRLNLLLLMLFLSLGVSGQQKRPVISGTTETKVDVIEKDTGELTTKDIAQRRDLTAYDEGGHLDCGNWGAKNKSKDICDEKKLRDFIWRHWTEKTAGYIRITYDGTDAKSTSHIFIEPDRNDRWRIVWRIVRRHNMPQYNNQITDIGKIVTVEHIENKPVKGEWALVFKDEFGDIIQKIPDFDY